MNSANACLNFRNWSVRLFEVTHWRRWLFLWCLPVLQHAVTRFNTKATKKDGKVGCKIEPSATNQVTPLSQNRGCLLKMDENGNCWFVDACWIQSFEILSAYCIWKLVASWGDHAPIGLDSCCGLGCSFWCSMIISSSFMCRHWSGTLVIHTSAQDTLTRDYCILRRLEPGCVLRDVEVMDRVLSVNGVKDTAPALARKMHPGVWPTRRRSGELHQIASASVKSWRKLPFQSISLLGHVLTSVLTYMSYYCSRVVLASRSRNLWPQDSCIIHLAVKSTMWEL